jgi:hypothetical protein
MALLGLLALAGGCGDGGSSPVAATGGGTAPGSGSAPAAAPEATSPEAPVEEEPVPGFRTADSGGSTPPPPPPAETPGTGSSGTTPQRVVGSPQITFEKTSHDFGTIIDTERVQTEFAFTNTGTGTLEIAEVKGSCGCTVATLTKRIFLPGEGDVIKASFDPKGRQGKQTKFITVISNAAGTANQRLTVSSMVEPMVTMSRMINMGTVPLGQAHKETLELTYRDADIEFMSVGTNNPHLTAELVETGLVATNEGGQERYKAIIELSLSDEAPWGLLYANRLNMRVRVRPTPDAEPIVQPYTVHISGRVFGEIEANPALLSVGTFPAGRTFEKSLVLSRSSGEPLSITEATVAESTMPGVEVRVEPIDEASARVVLFGDTAEYKGSIRGQIALQTNVQDEGELKIRFAGFARKQ